MGLIFDFLFGSEKSVSRKTEFEKQDLCDEFELLKKEAAEIKAKSKVWEKEFSKTISFRNKAQQLEKRGMLDKAIFSYLEAINYGEENDNLNIYNYSFDIDRVIILYGKTKQKKILINFLRDKIAKYEEIYDTKDWSLRLEKLTNDKRFNSASLSQNDIIKYPANKPTLGKRVEDFKKSMPEFNFYFDLQEGDNTFSYNNGVHTQLFKDLHQYNSPLKSLINTGKLAETKMDYKTAIETYELLISEEYEGPEPYDRLIVIYSKLNWVNEEKSTLERAILFFTNLKAKQRDYVLNLAAKYGMKEKALEFLNNDKKIFYYMGAFELYNPHVTRLKKWNARLLKFNKE